MSKAAQRLLYSVRTAPRPREANHRIRPVLRSGSHDERQTATGSGPRGWRAGRALIAISLSDPTHLAPTWPSATAARQRSASPTPATSSARTSAVSCSCWRRPCTRADPASSGRSRSGGRATAAPSPSAAFGSRTSITRPAEAAQEPTPERPQPCRPCTSSACSPTRAAASATRSASSSTAARSANLRASQSRASSASARRSSPMTSIKASSASTRPPQSSLSPGTRSSARPGCWRESEGRPHSSFARPEPFRSGRTATCSGFVPERVGVPPGATSARLPPTRLQRERGARRLRRSPALGVRRRAGRSRSRARLRSTLRRHRGRSLRLCIDAAGREAPQTARHPPRQRIRDLRPAGQRREGRSRRPSRTRRASRLPNVSTPALGSRIRASLNSPPRRKCGLKRTLGRRLTDPRWGSCRFHCSRGGRPVTRIDTLCRTHPWSCNGAQRRSPKPAAQAAVASAPRVSSAPGPDVATAVGQRPLAADGR